MRFFRNHIHFIKQHDSMQCGVACLAMICDFYGKKYPISYLSSICMPTNQGLSLLAIKKSAEQLGFECMCAEITLDQLTQLPCIILWYQNHFVVLYKVDLNAGCFWIADPAKGKYRLGRDEFEEHWSQPQTEMTKTGLAMFLHPTSLFHKVQEPTRKESHSFKFLLNYFLEYRKCFAIILSSLMLGCILQLIMPFLTQWIVDFGVRCSDIKLIWLILMGELAIVIGRTSTDFIRRWLLLHISMAINISLVSDFFIKLLKLPMSFFDTKHMGDILQRINDHNRIQTFLTTQALGFTFSILSFMIFGIVLSLYNLIIFIIFLVCCTIYCLWIVIFLSRRKVIDNELFELNAINKNRTYQFVSSMQEIKLQNCERRRRWEWEDTQADLFVAQMKSLKLQQTQEAGSVFINEIKNILITVFAATSVINGQISLGAMLAIQYMVGELNSPVEQVMSFVYSMQDVKISLERINEIHERHDEDTSENRITVFNGGKSICIDNIGFKYDPYAIGKTIKDISFCIPEGKVTAIVGASGSGKTTLIKLMLGYYPVISGSISVAGRNINEYNLKWWRQQCGVVMQDGVIFSESIARNIAVDDGEIDEDCLIKAAKIANIHEYIMDLPLRYSTIIGRDGIGLSQGQKQRILIARAVYKNPDFIFLDEATNALDAKNERTIVENLSVFYKTKTVVVVAHRLSTVKNADQIIVLDDGKVVESGCHSTLVENKGAYYNLVKNQLELGV